MILCPKCEGLATYNSYFGRHICLQCGWASDTDKSQSTHKVLKLKGSRKPIFA